MQIIDSHTHLWAPDGDAGAFCRELTRAGIDGAAVFSLPPQKGTLQPGFAYEQRISDLLRFTGTDARLLPVLWIHPYEDSIAEILTDAAARGVKGFKVICTDFYAGEDRAMAVWEKIAALALPVVFHSGILWDGNASSCYNRPVCFEPLIDVPHLRFLLAHVSWPWCDECIALYGKFLNAYVLRPRLSCEMFLDITPGTPPIYRKEVLTKLFTVGYDVRHNLLFGTDNTAGGYNTPWAQQWLQRDGVILDELGINAADRALLYGGNFRRFYGLDSTRPIRTVQLPDGSMQQVQ